MNFLIPNWDKLITDVFYLFNWPKYKWKTKLLNSEITIQIDSNLAKLKVVYYGQNIVQTLLLSRDVLDFIAKPSWTVLSTITKQHRSLTTINNSTQNNVI